jgi:hypothetical protein
MEEVTSLVVNVIQVPLFVKLAQLSFVLPLVIRSSYLSFGQYSSSLKCSPG